MNETHVLTIEGAIRHGLLSILGHINKAAARMAMEIMETVRERGATPIYAYYGIANACEPLVPIESFYIFVVYADGTHGLFMHAAASLRTIDPVHKSEGGLL